MTVASRIIFTSLTNKEENKLMNAYPAILMRIAILSSQFHLQSAAPTSSCLCRRTGTHSRYSAVDQVDVVID